MSNRLKFVAIVALIVRWRAAVRRGSVAADQPSGPQVSKSVVKQLKAAEDAVQAKKFDEALAKIKEAQSAPGEKTAYDKFVIDQLLLFIYVQKNDFTAAAPILESASQSQYATPEQQKGWLKALLGIRVPAEGLRQDG